MARRIIRLGLEVDRQSSNVVLKNFIIMENTISNIYFVDIYSQLHLEPSTAACILLYDYQVKGFLDEQLKKVVFGRIIQYSKYLSRSRRI